MDPYLKKKLGVCPNLPSIPAVALEVLDLSRKPDVDISRIATVVGKDPALSAKMLKTVNSSYYGCSSQITTVPQALVVLGLQSVKTLVLGFSLVGNVKTRKAGAFDPMTFWRRSFYTAAAGRELAKRLRLVQVEEAFIGGLLADIGMLALDAVLGQEYGRLTGEVASHVDLAVLERQGLGGDHAEVAGVLAESWRLPLVLSGPVRWHAQPDLAVEAQADKTIQTLARVLGVANRCADVFVDAEPAAAIADVLRDVGALLPDTAAAGGNALLASVSGIVREVAGTFDVDLNNEVPFEQILRDANQALIELTLSSQREVAVLQQHVVRSEAAFAEREKELRVAASTDPLTRLANRAEFDRFLAEELAEATGGRRPLSLILLDVDKFKNVNDRHGHVAGDTVLRHLGRMLAACVREGDLAARYGGEELAVVLPRTDRVTAAHIAEDLRATLAARCVDCGTVQLPVTASFGVAAFEHGGPLTTPQLLVRAADKALYHAKESGRNKVKVFHLGAQAA